MSKIFITADSTFDLPQEIMKEYGVTDEQIIRTGIVFGTDMKMDGIDALPEDVYKSVEKDNVMPKSNAANEEEYRELFEKNKDSKFHIHINVGNKLSASHGSAKRAAEGLKNVHVVDSRTLSSGTGILAIYARMFANEGLKGEEVVKKITEMAYKGQTSFVIDSLKYLHKGGRVSGLKLLGANLLRIHPELRVDSEGALVPGKKFKGNFTKVCKEYTRHILNSNPSADKRVVMVTYTQIDSSIPNEMERELKAAGFETVYQTMAGSVITCHCGRSTIGILFINK